MHDLLTTREVIDLLKIDRTTLYRMLKDGRLTGVKIGSQWRFHPKRVEALLAGENPLPKAEGDLLEMLPIFCVQPLQEVLADIAQVGVVTTTADGTPITEISHCSEFCQLILSTESGRESCLAAWRKLASQEEEAPRFVTCHAGLQYARARIRQNGTPVAMLIAGQFYTELPQSDEIQKRIAQLAKKHRLDAQQLTRAAEQITVIDQRWQERITEWLQKLANILGRVTRERADFIRRLQRITELSQVEKDYVPKIGSKESF